MYELNVFQYGYLSFKRKTPYIENTYNTLACSVPLKQSFPFAMLLILSLELGIYTDYNTLNISGLCLACIFFPHLAGCTIQSRDKKVQFFFPSGRAMVIRFVSHQGSGGFYNSPHPLRVGFLASGRGQGSLFVQVAG